MPNLFWRILITSYSPRPEFRDFMARAQTQEDVTARVTVAVLDSAESEQVFGVPLARRAIQPVFLRIENRGAVPLRLQLVNISPNYFTPLEAAGVCHFSIVKRLSAFGFLAWVFLPLLLLMPFKLITAGRANRRMDECFRALGFHLRPIPPGGCSEGFVFTPLDGGTKVVQVTLHGGGELRASPASSVDSDDALDTAATEAGNYSADQLTAEFTFSINVPGIAADYLHRDFAMLVPENSREECDRVTLLKRLEAMPVAVSNSGGTKSGDPVNLVVIGQFDLLIGAFAARWDESETITAATCWKTARSFLLGSQYRYSPVSALYLFGRSQDVALQRSRRSINERLHLRLWLTPLRFRGEPVWVGQVSRDIGVRFTTKTWNLTTHRIDPDVDESRDYVIEDILQAERVEAAGYVDGGIPCSHSAPRHNLTGDLYFTDGKRAVILLSTERMKPRFVAWF